MEYMWVPSYDIPSYDIPSYDIPSYDIPMEGAALSKINFG